MKRPPLFRSLIGFTFLLGAFALCAATRVGTAQQASFPEIFVVNSTGDQNDAFPGDGQCETAVGNGVCTLRAVIEEANAHAGGDGISFSIPTTDPGYSNGIWTIFTNALPAISDSVNITGPGADKLIISNPTTQQLPIFSVTTSGTVNISSVSLGSLTGQEPSSGSGILNSNGGTVNVTSCRFINSLVSSSSTTPAKGGGIYNNSGTVHVTSSTFSFNRADSPSQSRGAGIYNNNGTVSVVHSTFNNNNADARGGIFK